MKILGAFLGLAIIIGSMILLNGVMSYNKLRKMYIKRFEYYKSMGYVQDTYCNIYIEMFSKFRWHMFINFYVYGYTDLARLTDNINLYSNYKLSHSKKKEARINADEANEIFLYWRDQQK